MNRRNFLTALAGFTLDPERLLWTPGRKLISIPKPRVSFQKGDTIRVGNVTVKDIRAARNWLRNQSEIYYITVLER